MVYRDEPRTTAVVSADAEIFFRYLGTVYGPVATDEAYEILQSEPVLDAVVPYWHRPMRDWQVFQAFRTVLPQKMEARIYDLHVSTGPLRGERDVTVLGPVFGEGHSDGGGGLGAEAALQTARERAMLAIRANAEEVFADGIEHLNVSVAVSGAPVQFYVSVSGTAVQLGPPPWTE